MANNWNLTPITIADAESGMGVDKSKGKMLLSLIAYLGKLNAQQRTALLLNGAFIFVALGYLANFLAEYNWSHLFSFYSVKSRTFGWIFDFLYLLFVIFPIAILCIGIYSKRFKLDNLKKSYQIIILCLMPIVISMIAFLMVSWPLIEIMLNPRKL